ncbi:MAG: hypothetical protein EOP14_00115 [Pseudomonas sp.]|nr:MAG: hypothetical protein EOP14_00115 [Pseudomonas sp.]
MKITVINKRGDKFVLDAPEFNRLMKEWEESQLTTATPQDFDMWLVERKKPEHDVSGAMLKLFKENAS